MEQLTFEKASELAGALQKLGELNRQKIATAESDAEKKGLTAFLSNSLPKYANELIGTWFVCHQEYEPLVGSVAALLRRANGINARVQAVQVEAK